MSKDKLPLDFKLKLLKALRSPNCYKFTTGRLKRKQRAGSKQEYAYCALGVACDLAGIQDIGADGMPSAGDSKYDKLPDVLKLGGGHGDHASQIASLNDRSRSYKEAADYIEANL